jgi:hypothetical protein
MFQRYAVGKELSAGYSLVFTSDAIESFADGNQYNTLTIELRDKSTQFAPHNFYINFRVIAVNTAPVITIDEETRDVHQVAQTVGKPWSGSIKAIDEDLANGYMVVTLTLEAEDAGNSAQIMVGQVAGLENFEFEKKTAKEVRFKATQDDVTAILAQIKVSAPGNEKKASKAILTITANDQGNSGQCPNDNDISPKPCPLEATTKVEISWGAIEDNSMVTIAASASAAGFAALAAIAAVAAFRKFNEKAEEGYEPWADGTDEGTVDNPLYQQSGNSGTSAIYESK